MGAEGFIPWFILPTRYDRVYAEMGAYTERVERPEQIRPALERAFASGRTSVIDAVVDPTVQPTAGVPRTIESTVKGMLAWADPEDFPDEIRYTYIEKRV